MDGREESTGNDKKDEEQTLTETKRVSRNMNEKKRRDRFNLLINELAVVISPSNRNCKYEKITVLKEAIACLRNQQDASQRGRGVTVESRNNWQTTLVGGSELSQIIVEAMNGFVLSLDCSGIITFASDSILSSLGYRSKEMVDNSIADFLHQSDRSSIFSHLNLLQKEERTVPPPSFNFAGKSKPLGSALAFQMNFMYGPHIDKKGVITISCCGQPFTVSRNTYQQPVTPAHESSEQNAKLQLVIIGSVRRPKPTIMVPLSNLKAKEFTSRLSLGWTYTYVEPRALLIVGYLPCELIEKSAYLFVHEDDIANVSLYHEMLGRKGRVNTCYYRFLTKGQTWVWLRSCCYVSYNQWNSKPEYVTSTSTAVNYEEVCANQENLLKEDSLKFQNISKTIRPPSKKTPSVRGIPQTSTTPQGLPSEQPSLQSLTDPLQGTNKPYNSRKQNAPVIDILRPDDSLRKHSEGFVPEPVDEDLGMDVDSISSESSELDSSLSTMRAPDGLTPAQSKLHIQLQGKHKALEKSIKYQIDELERIKKQIEINKQLWEFNKQLQEKKNLTVDKGIEKILHSPTKRTPQSESSFSSESGTPPLMKRPLLQTSNTKYTVPCPVEIPVSHYVNIPPIDLGDPSIIYGMDQVSQPVMDTSDYTTNFSNSLTPSISSISPQPYPYYPYQPPQS